MTNWRTVPDAGGWKFQRYAKKLLSEVTVPVSQWTEDASGPSLSGISYLLNLVEAGEAFAAHGDVVLDHQRVAGMERSIADAVGMAHDVPYVLDIQHHGTIDTPEFRFRASWVQPNGQPVLGSETNGSSLRYGAKTYRVPEPFFSLISAVDEFNSLSIQDITGRLRAWAKLQESLPPTSVESITTSGYVGSTRIARAASFSLSLKSGASGFTFDPVLFGARLPHAQLEGALPEELHGLLPPLQQQVFAVT